MKITRIRKNVTLVLAIFGLALSTTLVNANLYAAKADVNLGANVNGEQIAEDCAIGTRIAIADNDTDTVTATTGCGEIIVGHYSLRADGSSCIDAQKLLNREYNIDCDASYSSENPTSDDIQDVQDAQANSVGGVDTQDTGDENIDTAAEGDTQAE